MPRAGTRATGGAASGGAGATAPGGAGAAASGGASAPTPPSTRSTTAYAAELTAAREAVRVAENAARTANAALEGTAAAAGAPYEVAQRAASDAAQAVVTAQVQLATLESGQAAGGGSARGARTNGDSEESSSEDDDGVTHQERLAALAAQMAKLQQRGARRAAREEAAARAARTPEQHLPEAAATGAENESLVRRAQAAHALQEQRQREAEHAMAASAAAARQAEQLDAQLATAQRSGGGAAAHEPMALPVSLARRALQFQEPQSAFGHGASTVNHVQLKSALSAMKSGNLPELTAARDASKAGALEDWLYKLRNVVDVAGVTDFATQLKVLAFKIDRQLATWLAGATEQAAYSGLPFRSLEDVATAMRAQYTPQSDEDTARREMISKLHQRLGETMEAFTSRAQELYNRVSRARLPSEVAAELLLDGVDARRFVLTMHGVRQQQQTQRRVNGVGLSFASVRAALVAAAVNEPLAWGPQQQAREGGSGRSGGGGGGGGGERAPYRGPSNKQRVNNLTAAGGAEEPGSERDDGSSDCGDGREGFNAVDVNDVRCYRCKEMGHYAATCKQPDMRQCNKCKKKGHLARDCRSAKKASGSRNANTQAKGDAQQKN